MTDFTPEETEEFKTEALELLDEAERNLLSLEKGGDFPSTYAAVFRVFHSLKGGAGMLNLQYLAAHMHKLENHYQECKLLISLPDYIASYFLDGIDSARKIIAGQNVKFDYMAFKLGSTSQQMAPNPSESVPQIKLDRKSAGPLEGSRILVIDDEPDIVNILQDLLIEHGAEVAGFTSPKDAFDQIKTFMPDAVLTDYKMPELTGLEILKKVAQLDPDLPVIFASGYLSKEVLIEALSYGVFGALEKPFREEAVITICRNAAKRYRLVKLLNTSISLVYFQYSDIDQFLRAQGANEIREEMYSRLKMLLEAKRQLR